MPARISFFIGKGGVGKTTVAASYALWRAKKAARPLILLSTDPAHSLGDVLRRELSDEATRIHKRLFAREIDAGAELRRFLTGNREHILKVIEKGSFFTADEVGPLLDATLPGMAEIAGLLAIDELLESSEYEEIVVDTAPMGHTLRMFAMPAHFARLLEFLRTASSRDELLAARFAGRRLPPDPFLEQWQAMVERLRRSLAGPDSQISIVTTPEPFAVEETLRASEWLRDEEGNDILVASIVLNRSVSRRTGCGNCDRRTQQYEDARRELSEAYPGSKILRGADPGAPLLGAEQLTAFGRHVFEERPLRTRVFVPRDEGEPKFAAAEWPVEEREMCFTLGKGGVGKTTISAGLAFRTREVARATVTICSTDPAPSLDDVFDTEVGGEPSEVLGDRGLRAAEIDALGEYSRWADQVRERVAGSLTDETPRGLHLDLSYDRHLIDALLDVVPPGVDEIFAILRISEMVKRGERLIIDMAPTGHAIDLLQTPDRLLAWTRMLLKTLAANRTLPLARDAGVEVATIQHKVRELATVMKDRRRSAVDVVMLAEPLPDRETRRLLRTLRAMGAAVERVFVNRVHLQARAGCARCSRARRWQMHTIRHLNLGGAEVVIVPEVAGGVAGKHALERFTRQLWRMA